MIALPWYVVCTVQYSLGTRHDNPHMYVVCIVHNDLVRVYIMITLCTPKYTQTDTYNEV